MVLKDDVRAEYYNCNEEMASRRKSGKKATNRDKWQKGSICKLSYVIQAIRGSNEDTKQNIIRSNDQIKNNTRY